MITATLSLSPHLLPNHDVIVSKPQFQLPISRLKLSSSITQLPSIRHKTVAFGTNSGGGNGNSFIDENGAVDDMDGYLNQLSLEYDSVWDTKPSWCQPWTIMLTGVLTIGGSWLLLHSVVITTAVLALISVWWYIFLFSFPKEYSDMIAERRTKIATGVEDTFGSTKGR